MHSRLVSATSAILLASAGVVLLFAADDLLPWLIDGYPATGAWLGQLVGAGYLAVANLNWMTRRSVIGGLFGRPVVVANTTLFFVSFLSLATAGSAAGWPMSLSLGALITGLMVALYGWLMFRGPFRADQS